jgi:hypothetical protein
VAEDQMLIYTSPTPLLILVISSQVLQTVLVPLVDTVSICEALMSREAGGLELEEHQDVQELQIV